MRAAALVLAGAVVAVVAVAAALAVAAGGQDGVRLVRRLRPDVTVHFHQALALVNRSAGVVRAVVRRYASVARLPARTLPRDCGTAAEWQNTVLPGTSAFAVELPAGPLSPAAVRRHAAAVLAVARTAG